MIGGMQTSNDQCHPQPSTTPQARPSTGATPSTGSHVVCEHAWSVESRHRTSEGVVHYVRCVRCSMRRIDTVVPGGMVPVELSRTITAGECVDRTEGVGIRRRLAQGRGRMARVSRLWVFS